MKKSIHIFLLIISTFFFDKATAQTEVVFYTSMGNFNVMLTDTLTPITVDSFLARVADRFYDGLIFHRVIDKFMIQGGDPVGNGTGGPGYTIPDEFDPSLKNIPKALAMANAGPNTGGSQFFINLVYNNHLNNKHTVFGMVVANFSVVQSIGKVPVDANNDKPLTDVVIDSIRVAQFPTSVAQVSSGIDVSVYPNPNTGSFHIKLPATDTEVEIVNMNGSTVYSTTGKDLITVDMKDKPRGLYIVRMKNENGLAEQKLIVQ